MTPRLLVLALGLVLLAALGLVPFLREETLAAEERAEERVAAEGPGEPVAASLVDVRRDESPWLGKRVRFALQFRETVPDWNPCLSRFGPAHWAAFAAWPDEAFLWHEKVFEDSCATLFVRRGSALEERLAAAVPFDRLQAVGVVREAFLGEPWIEIEGLEPLEGSVAEGTILHVSRAREFVLEGQWELALQQFERAKAAPLPAHALAEIDRQVEECERLRDEEAARKSR
jgi:hypothetical protein